ncbi:hypothetical protein CAPTEDRAFT_206956 [Capitella teleta]|uniref:TIR domain-containing protein n=1 Tax=Capitella teleta TaxID=283909 RepID=R7UZL5_CAPTE|nr:hypothetical protein CAPTEDRAFT_206956 [Capitella teleta]|eukprot:ELU08886.1 hypothetical protein CAPTEDRAFT_206956 [Capitella teleta]
MLVNNINETVLTTGPTCNVIERNETGCPLGFPCIHGYCMNETEAAGNFMRFRCGTCCERNCSSHGLCVVDEEAKSTCSCDWGYSGDYCEVTDGPTGNLATLPAKDVWKNKEYFFVLLLLILLISGILTIYFLWRRKAAVVMRLVDKYQIWRENSNAPCQYDAFVSYRTQDPDESFVYKQLRRKLEDEAKLKLCLHGRDFTPGEAIANNIISAVNNSRYTILILSPRFVESEWTRFEYQVAQRSMLQLRHRIIPVLFEDFEIQNSDPNLRLILSTITYLKWDPEQSTRFWEKLNLILNKNS